MSNETTLEEAFCTLGSDFFNSHNATPAQRISCTKAFVRANYPTPGFSTLENGAVIKDVETATFGCGVVVIVKIDGVRYVLMGQAGPHCEKEFKSNPRNEGKEFRTCYAIPGGFGNLTKTEGSSQVPANEAQAENGFQAMARETEEEFPKADGSPLISIDPDDITLMDTLTLNMGPNNKRIVMGGLYEATEQQCRDIVHHVERMEDDADYKQRVTDHTINKQWGLAEVSDNKLFLLDDLADSIVPLYHEDQRSLFQKVQRHYQRQDAMISNALAVSRYPG